MEISIRLIGTIISFQDSVSRMFSRIRRTGPREGAWQGVFVFILLSLYRFLYYSGIARQPQGVSGRTASQFTPSAEA